MVSLEEYLEQFPPEKWDEIAARWNADKDGLSLAEDRPDTLEGEEEDVEEEDLFFDDDDDYPDDEGERPSGRFVLTDELGEKLGTLSDGADDALSAAVEYLVDFSNADTYGYAVTDMRVPKKMMTTKSPLGTVLFAVEIAHQIGWTVYFVVDTGEESQ